MNQNLLELISISQWYFPSNTSDKQQILSNINIEIKAREIIAIVGKSGSGKSTLLKIIAGLVPPQAGEIRFVNPTSPPSISMVFQTIALFPWLNVIENIEIGLKAQGKLNEEGKQHVEEFIKLMGLDGFENAMPRELSGGMKQRVSLARGLASNPDILILDEPFTTLDVLTAKNLKNDFLKLWEQQITSLKSVVMVTHSIEEALEMADRIIVLGHTPSEIVADSKVSMTYPRNIKSEEFQQKEEEIFAYMTETEIPTSISKDTTIDKEAAIVQKLPTAYISDMIALVQLLNSKEYSSQANISDLVNSLGIKMSRLMAIIEALALLKFMKVIEGDIELTEIGKNFAILSIDDKKDLFVKQLHTYVPLSNYILHIIKDKKDHRVAKAQFIKYLEDYMSQDEAKYTLRTIINWARFGEIFFYDDNKQEFLLENPA